MTDQEYELFERLASVMTEIQGFLEHRDQVAFAERRDRDVTLLDSPLGRLVREECLKLDAFLSPIRRARRGAPEPGVHYIEPLHPASFMDTAEE